MSNGGVFLDLGLDKQVVIDVFCAFGEYISYYNCNLDRKYFYFSPHHALFFLRKFLEDDTFRSRVRRFYWLEYESKIEDEDVSRVESLFKSYDGLKFVFVQY